MRILLLKGKYYHSFEGIIITDQLILLWKLVNEK